MVNAIGNLHMLAQPGAVFRQKAGGGRQSVRFAAAESAGVKIPVRHTDKQEQSWLGKLLHGFINLITFPFRYIGGCIIALLGGATGGSTSSESAARSNVYVQKFNQVANQNPKVKNLILQLSNNKTLPTYGDNRLMDKLGFFIQYLETFSKYYQPSGEPPEVAANCLQLQAATQKSLKALLHGSAKDQYTSTAFILERFLDSQLEQLYRPFFEQYYNENNLGYEEARFRVFQNINDDEEVDNYQGAWLKTPVYYSRQFEKLARKFPEFRQHIDDCLRHDDAFKMLAIAVAENDYGYTQKLISTPREELPFEEQQFVDALDQLKSGDPEAMREGAEFFAGQIREHPDVREHLINEVLNAVEKRFFGDDTINSGDPS